MSLPSAAQSGEPNVLVIVVDDLNTYLAHPHFGRPDVITPNIDRICSNGVTFTQAFAQWTSCAPSRQSFMSGRHPEVNQYAFYGDIGERDGRNRSVRYMPEVFAEHGYTTIRLDKVFHIGRDVEDIWDLTEEPFKNADGSNRTVSQFSELSALGFNSTEYTETKYTEQGGEDSTVIIMDELDRNGLPITPERLTDGITATRALEILDDLAVSGEKFFMMVGFRRPHLPFMAAKSYFDLYNPATLTLPPQNDPFTNVTNYRMSLQGYYACLTQTDNHIGKLLDKLETTGLDDDTLIVFFGDHGYGLGERDKFFAKGNLYNVSLHTPLAFVLPGGGPRAGEAEEESVGLIDVYPTLLDLCGIPADGLYLDGRSLAPLLSADDPDWVDGALSYHGDNNDYTLPLDRSIHSDGWRYVKTGAGSEDLFDHSVDPWEWNDLAGAPAHAAKQGALETRMMERMNRSATRRPPEVVTHPPAQYIVPGANALLTVNEEGDLPVTCQWFKDAVALPGETNTSLTLANFQTADAGLYHCALRSDWGQTLSYPTVLKTIASAGTLIDVQIDDADPQCVIDGANGTRFIGGDISASQTFGPGAMTSQYPTRPGFVPVSPGVPHGSYAVSLWSPSWSKRTTDADVTLHTRSGPSSVSVNQMAATGGWVAAGTFELNPLSWLQLFTTPGDYGSDSSKRVAIDGFRFQRLTAPVNQPPVAVDDGTFVTHPDTAIQIDALANDSDPEEDPLSIFQIASGLYGDVEYYRGQITYTPRPGVASGTDVVYYQAFDGKAPSNPAFFTVDIRTAAGSAAVAVDVLDDRGTVNGLTQTAYPVGGAVNLTAVPDSGFQFYHWDGDLRSEANPLAFPVDGPTRLTAVFRPLSTLTSYAAWRAWQPWANEPADGEPGVDVELDHNINFGEYAFDLNPFAPDPSVITGRLIEAAGQMEYHFTFRRNLRAEDLTWVVKTTGDLSSSWTPYGGAQTVTDYNPDGDFSAQEITVSIPAASNETFFIAVEAQAD